jgi:hypothetical protein
MAGSAGTETQDVQNAQATGGATPTSPTAAGSGTAASSFSAALAAASPTSSTGSSNANGSIEPASAAESAYELVNYILDSGKSVVLGTEFGSLLGLSSTARVSLANVYKAVSQLTQARAQTLMTTMNSAGLLSSSDGQPIDIGNPNDPNFITSMFEGLISASNANTPYSTYVATLQSSGTGVQSTQALPQAQVGGGNTYQIQLTNSADTQAALIAAFQQAMGTMPTAAQIAAFTSSFNQQEVKYEGTQNAIQEQSSVNKYNEGVTSAGIAAQSQQKLAVGNVPSKINSPAQYAVALLQYLNKPTNASNVAAITGMINNLGLWGNGHFNPLGSSYGVGGSQANPTTGQMTYQGWAQSIQATAEALSAPQYQNLLAALQTGQGSTALSTSGAAQQEANKFTNGTLNTATLNKDVNAAHGPANHAINNTNGVGSGAKGAAAASQPAGSIVPGPQGSNGAFNPSTTANKTAAGKTKLSILNGHYNEQGQWVGPEDTATQAGGGGAVTNLGPQGLGGNLNPQQDGPANPRATPAPVAQGNPNAASVGDAPQPNTNAGQQGAVGNAARTGAGTSPTVTSPSANPTNPANQYEAATQTTNVAPPSVSNAATVDATTGANATPYAAYQALQAYNAILDLINNRGTAPTVQGIIGSGG